MHVLFGVWVVSIKIGEAYLAVLTLWGHFTEQNKTNRD